MKSKWRQHYLKSIGNDNDHDTGNYVYWLRIMKGLEYDENSIKSENNQVKFSSENVLYLLCFLTSLAVFSAIRFYHLISVFFLHHCD